MNRIIAIFLPKMFYSIFLTGSLLLLMRCNHSIEVEEETDARIVPGKSVDGVKLGDSREAVVAKLGKPDGGGITDGIHRAWHGIDYLQGQYAGFSIYFAEIDNQAGPADLLVVQSPYEGSTKEGISIGSSINIVRRAYGLPRKTISNPDNLWIVDFYCFNNKELEIHYSQNGLVTGISIGYFLPMPRDTENPCK